MSRPKTVHEWIGVSRKEKLRREGKNYYGIGATINANRQRRDRLMREFLAHSRPHGGDPPPDGTPGASE